MVLSVTAILVLVESSLWWAIKLIVRRTEHAQAVHRLSIELGFHPPLAHRHPLYLRMTPSIASRAFPPFLVAVGADTSRYRCRKSCVRQDVHGGTLCLYLTTSYFLCSIAGVSVPSSISLFTHYPDKAEDRVGRSLGERVFGQRNTAW